MQEFTFPGFTFTIRDFKMVNKSLINKNLICLSILFTSPQIHYYLLKFSTEKFFICPICNITTHTITQNER